MLSKRNIRVVFATRVQTRHTLQKQLAVSPRICENTTFERTTRRWFDKYRAGNRKLGGRSRLSEIDNVLKAMVGANPKTSNKQIAEELGALGGNWKLKEHGTEWRVAQNVCRYSTRIDNVQVND